MKKTVALLLAFLALLSVTAFARQTEAPADAKSETGQLNASQLETLADKYPDLTLQELTLADGTGVLQILEVRNEDTPLSSETPLIFSDLFADDPLIDEDEIAYIYYDVVAPGGWKRSSSTYDLKNKIWQQLLFPEKSPESGDVLSIGEFDFTLTWVGLDEDEDGEAIVGIRYSFTNNSQESTSAFYEFFIDAYQDGVSLAWADLKDTEFRDFDMAEPGETITDIDQGFVPLSDSQLTIEVSAWMGDDETVHKIVVPYPDN